MRSFVSWSNKPSPEAGFKSADRAMTSTVTGDDVVRSAPSIRTSTMRRISCPRVARAARGVVDVGGGRLRRDSRLSPRVRTGSAPDPRSQRHARCRGYDLSDLRARALNRRDFERVDLLLTMDGDNLDCVTERCPPAQAHKLARLMAYCRVHSGSDVPDPCYGSADGFERVLDLVEDACDGLLAHVGSQLRARRRAAGDRAARRFAGA